MASEGDDPLLATLRLVETLAGVGYWRYDPRTEAVTWSDQVYRIHGLVPGSLEPSFALVVEAYHPDDRPILLQHVAKTLATGEGYNFKLRLRRPNDGQERTVRAIAEATVDATGRTCEIFGVFQDITEEVESRARLEESETRYRLLADASIDIIIKFSPDGLIQYVSPAIRRYGYQPEDLVGKPRGLLVHPDDVERVRQVFLGLTSDNPPNPSRNRGFRFLTADGGHVWMEGNPAIVRGDDGSFRAIVSSLRDITDQRAAQIALTESEARYRFLAEHTQDIIVRAGPGGIISYASPSSRMLGIEPSDAIGRSTLDFVAEQDREVARAALEQLFTGGDPDPALTREYRTVTTDGRTLWIEGRPNIIRDDQGRPVEFVTSFRDVTERRTLADELKAANAVAHDALRQKADFLANVSHDLKTPLSAILGFANALKASANADAALAGARIVEQGEELLVMVGDLLDRAALDAGRLTPRSSSFVVKDMLSSIRDVLLHAAADRGVELITEVDSEIPLQVVGDKNRIRRILMNIAANAIKFSDGGAVVIFVTRGPTAGFLRFVVSDRGPGLSDRIAAQVFERFTTATAAGATDRRGYGLGLAICRELVEELGGQIGHRSAGETGTTFWFDIPLPLSAQIDPFAGGRAVSPLNILVVDDNIAFQHIIGSMLRALGHSVVCANNAKQGMAAAKEAAYDLYYIDRGLPDKNGLDLIRQLREAGINRPMVLVSADDSSIADEGAVMPDAFLAKPLDPTDVVASLSTVARAS